MDYAQKVKELREATREAETLFAFKNKVEGTLRLFRENSTVRVVVENNGVDVKGYPTETTESCQIVGDFRERVMEALKAQLEAINQEFEEKFKED